jgi:copper transport protein
LILALALAGDASAHAEYVGSDPPANGILPVPPDTVSITLSEAAQPGTATIRVTNVSGARLDSPPVSLSPDGRTISVALAPIGPGVYTATWTVTSAVDGHFTAGSFSFAVQNPDGSLPGPLPVSSPSSSGSPVSPAEVALRFLGFLGLSMAFGGAFLAAFIWIPTGRDPDAREAVEYGVTFGVLLHWARVGAFVLGLAMVGLWAQAAGLEGSAASAIFGSPYLLSVLLRFSFAAALFVVLSSAFSRSRVAEPEASAGRVRIAVGLALAAIVAGSAGTHAAAIPSLAPLGVAADAAHLVGVALWVGGLVGVAAVRGFLRRDENLRLARHVFARFSRLAGFAVGLVLGAGVALSVLLVGSVEALVETGYGWVVLGKVALFAPMLALGAYNRYRLVPRTAEAPQTGEAVRRLALNVRAEAALGAAVLALAGLLTAMPPAASLAGGPQAFTLTATADGIRVDLQVYPYPSTPGVYTFSILLWNATNGQGYDGGRNGTLTFGLVNRTLPPQVANLSGPHGNHYFVTTPALSQPGVWKIDARFSRVDGFDLRATFHILLGDAS